MLPDHGSLSGCARAICFHVLNLLLDRGHTPYINMRFWCLFLAFAVIILVLAINIALACSLVSSWRYLGLFSLSFLCVFRNVYLDFVCPFFIFSWMHFFVTLFASWIVARLCCSLQIPRAPIMDIVRFVQDFGSLSFAGMRMTQEKKH